MKIINTTVKSFKVTFGVIEQGETPRQVREAMNMQYGADSSLTLIGKGKDYEDAADLEWSLPDTAVALKAAGVDLAAIRGFISLIVH